MRPLLWPTGNRGHVTARGREQAREVQKADAGWRRGACLAVPYHLATVTDRIGCACDKRRRSPFTIVHVMHVKKLTCFFWQATWSLGARAGRVGWTIASRALPLLPWSRQRPSAASCQRKRSKSKLASRRRALENQSTLLTSSQCFRKRKRRWSKRYQWRTLQRSQSVRNLQRPIAVPYERRAKQR